MLRLNKGENNMYIRKEKNNMRTPEEKEIIVKDMLEHGFGQGTASKKYNVSESCIWNWRKKYLEKGIDGLKTNIGKSKGDNKGLTCRKPKNREEELEIKLLKTEIELMRLKKGYVVKGVGAKKEYISISDMNMK